MSGKETIQCNQCGKNIALENGMEKGFCLHCGEPFEIKNERANISHAHHLYQERKWRLLLEYVKDEKDDPQFIAYKAISTLFVLILDYEKDVDELAERVKPRNPIQLLFTSKVAFSEDPLHKLFYENVEHSTAALGKLFESPLVPDTIKEDASSVIVTELLRPKGGETTPTYWSFIACQQHAIPLIPFLPVAALMAIYMDYDYHNPKNQSLPNQLNVRNAFIQAIKGKGEKLPSHRQVRKTFQEQQKAAKQNVT